MRVVINLSSQTKQSAEAQAHRLGYPSLAALLKVTATLLAGHAKPDEVEENQVSAQKIIPAGKLPHPDQFTEWPPYISPNIAFMDPDLYAFYIQIGLIR